MFEVYIGCRSSLTACDLSSTLSISHGGDTYSYNLSKPLIPHWKGIKHG
jgi:hypothetical protein